MKCEYCGKEIPDNSIYCLYCAGLQSVNVKMPEEEGTVYSSPRRKNTAYRPEEDEALNESQNKPHVSRSARTRQNVSEEKTQFRTDDVRQDESKKNYRMGKSEGNSRSINETQMNLNDNRGNKREFKEEKSMEGSRGKSASASRKKHSANSVLAAASICLAYFILTFYGITELKEAFSPWTEAIPPYVFSVASWIIIGYSVYVFYSWYKMPEAGIKVNVTKPAVKCVLEAVLKTSVYCVIIYAASLVVPAVIFEDAQMVELGEKAVQAFIPILIGNNILELGKNIQGIILRAQYSLFNNFKHQKQNHSKKIKEIQRQWKTGKLNRQEYHNSLEKENLHFMQFMQQQDWFMQRMDDSQFRNMDDMMHSMNQTMQAVNQNLQETENMFQNMQNQSDFMFNNMSSGMDFGQQMNDFNSGMNNFMDNGMGF